MRGGHGGLVRSCLEGTSLAVQWLRLHASTAGGMGSIPGRGTKIPHAARCGQKRSCREEEREGMQKMVYGPRMLEGQGSGQQA